ncbi:MAG: 50S ribosomal protein L11 methyltransferase [Chloroflexi bacterium]|nr:50S ribosomal protein L11 methyltransferase [Chloroflexota bacterium]
MAPRREERWAEISVEADRNAVDDLTALLGRHCAGGAVVEDDLGRADAERGGRVVVKGFLPVDDRETQEKLEIALLLLSRSSGISEPRLRVLEPEDWAESWKVHFLPQRIGERFVVVPTWQEYAPRPEEVVILLDPGMAFGTGLHATTRLCLRAAEALARPGVSVLDVGSGSGILAIGAALLGAGPILALDMDPIAVEVAQENATLNGVAEAITVCHGTLRPEDDANALPRQVAPEGYDLILANILAEVISAMAPALARALAPGGTLVTSGILASKADGVAEALTAAGLTVVERPREEEWEALIARHAGAGAPGE